MISDLKTKGALVSDTKKLDEFNKEGKKAFEYLLLCSFKAIVAIHASVHWKQTTEPTK